jgi:protein SERAC1
MKVLCSYLATPIYISQHITFFSHISSMWSFLTTAWWSQRRNISTANSEFPDGLSTWDDSDTAMVDICLIHGLCNGRDNTWTVPGQSSPWPKGLLPGIARVLAFGYHPKSPTLNIDACTKNLLVDLVRERSRCHRRPLVFIAHDLGGQLCEMAILRSRDNPEPHLRTIFNST